MPASPPLVPDSSRHDWTVEEVELLPEDGNRYEVIDGELLVTPAPTVAHQRASRELVRLLLPYLDGTGFELLYAPTAVRFGARSVVEPDVLVLPRSLDASARSIAGLDRLVLMVEIISPSSARADRYRKRAAYLAHGVPEYWIVDTAGRYVERWRPGDDEPEVLLETLVWQLADAPEPLVVDLAAYFRAVLGE